MIRGPLSVRLSSIRTMRACASSSRSPTSSNRIEPFLARLSTVAGPSIEASSPAPAITKGSVRRSEKSWIARAISDLPVPDSPVMSTGSSVFITRATSR
jgi:hypothetical protein